MNRYLKRLPPLLIVLASMISILPADTRIPSGVPAAVPAEASVEAAVESPAQAVVEEPAEVPAPPQEAPKNFVVYFPSWAAYGPAHQGMTVGMIPWDKVTVINHAFFYVNESKKNRPPWLMWIR